VSICFTKYVIRPLRVPYFVTIVCVHKGRFIVEREGLALREMLRALGCSLLRLVSLKTYRRALSTP
jgi:hypothetical protein